MTNTAVTGYPDNFFIELYYGVVELAEWTEGDVVQIDPGGTGVITAVMTSNFEFPTGEDETRKIEASSDSPMYVVAVDDGARVVSEDELEEGSFEGDSKDPKKLAQKAELTDVYSQLEDPYSVEELANIPGVDDPEVGFASLPDGWTRSSVLQAWASLGGTFTSCRTDMAGEISRPSNFCAAMKDELLMTEKWRNSF